MAFASFGARYQCSNNRHAPIYAMRVTAQLLRGVGHATGMAWLGRREFFSHCAWRQYRPNGTALEVATLSGQRTPNVVERIGTRCVCTSCGSGLRTVCAQSHAMTVVSDCQFGSHPSFRIAAAWRGVTSRGSEGLLRGGVHTATYSCRACYAESVT